MLGNMNTAITLWSVPANTHYNYFLELCSLIFLVAIAIAYFSRKKFPVAIFKLFGVCLGAVTFNLSIDILSCVFLDHSDVIPVFACELTNELYYFSQIFCSYLLFAYVFYSVGKSLRFSPIYLLTILPSALGTLLIFTNCLHHGVFTLTKGDNGIYYFAYGKLFFLLYVVAGLNIFASALYTVTFRKKLSKRLTPVLFSVIGLVLSALIVQAIQKQYIVMGIAYTLSMMFAIVTVNDPDEKVDRISNAFNNDAFVDYINNQRQERQRKFYIVFDIESFAMFNETFGVIYANELVSEIRKYIESVNKKTFIFKTQASRFVLLLRNKDEQTAMVGAIKERFSKPFNFKNHVVNITINLFYFENNECFKNSDSYTDFLNRVSSALYYVDSNYIELDHVFIDRVKRDRRIKEILEECLKNHTGLYMVYQPIFDVNEKRFNHYEALIRLDNNELGYVGPAEFIPIAESFGLANEIDYFVLNETCDFLKRNPHIENLEINISCAEFFNNPSDRFLKTINSYGINPERLCLEITETVAVKYPAKTKEFMDDLSRFGVKFAMDDFGSGYSNIARFISLPFSYAKLDKSLLSEEDNVKIFLDSAVHLFKNLNIPIIIEGVETEKQLAVSTTKEIEFVQGYYYSKPLKEEDLLAFLKAKNA